jgi:hypothetical protein
VPAPAYPAVLGDLAYGLRDAVGDELVGLYLYGSVVTGGFDPEASDIDLVAVTKTDASSLNISRLRRVHADLVALNPNWADRIEVVYVGEATLRSFRDGGPLAVISPGEPLHVVEGADLYLQNWYLVRLTSVALIGPAREEVFPAISSDEFVAAVARYAGEVSRRSVASMSPGMRAYTVLTMCRALRTVSTHAPSSKKDGAESCRQRHPEWAPLIDAALACRLSGGRQGFDDPESIRYVEAFVRAIADEIAGISPP